MVHGLERAWLAPPRWLLLLLPLEWLFAAITAIRRLAFRHGWFASSHPGVPVIVVGNLSVGGTGKTPVVIETVRLLLNKGYRVAVISRGYGGSIREPTRVEEGMSAAETGDEAMLVANSTGAPVYVGRDRAAVAHRAAAEGAQVIVSDDGLQHYALQRDIEIVTMDAATGFGNGHLLPVGPLREPAHRMADVDFVLERGGQDSNTALAYEPRCWRRLHGDEERPLENPAFGPSVYAIAGIARPGRFFDALRRLGLEPIDHALRDHAAPDENLMDQLTDLPLVMTSKDEVKFPAGRHPDGWVLEMSVVFPDSFAKQLTNRLPMAAEST